MYVNEFSNKVPVYVNDMGETENTLMYAWHSSGNWFLSLLCSNE